MDDNRDTDERIEAAIAHLQSRARDEVDLEKLLQQFKLADTPEAAVEVIYAHFAATRKSGESVSPDSYINGFPQYRQHLQKLFELDKFIDSTDREGATTLEDAPVQQSSGTLTSEEFITNLLRSDLIPESDVEELLSSLPDDTRSEDGESLANYLVENDILTSYQVTLLKEGRGRELKLGRYTVVDKLGQGGMGVVLKAQHPRMKRFVALKTVSPKLLQTPELIARFQREVDVAAHLDHPNVVAAYDADQAGSIHFLVMQFIQGEDLASHIKRRGPLSVAEALDCIRQAAEGLSYAHSQGVVHRDIKPSNLMLADDGTVKILDLGLARFEMEDATSSDLTGTGAVIGTVDFMAPEQAEDTKQSDQRSDIYSLGCTLYYLLNGNPPFGGNTAVRKILAHRNDEIPPVLASGRQPSNLQSIFNRMIAKDPVDRFQTMEEALQALASPDLLVETTVSATDDSQRRQRGIRALIKSWTQSTARQTDESSTEAETTILYSSQQDTDSKLLKDSQSSEKTDTSLHDKPTRFWTRSRLIQILLAFIASLILAWFSPRIAESLGLGGRFSGDWEFVNRIFAGIYFLVAYSGWFFVSSLVWALRNRMLIKSSELLLKVFGIFFVVLLLCALSFIVWNNIPGVYVATTVNDTKTDESKHANAESLEDHDDPEIERHRETRYRFISSTTPPRLTVTGADDRPIIFVLDWSLSMLTSGNDRHLVSLNALSSLLDQDAAILPNRAKVGLVMFGHRVYKENPNGLENESYIRYAKRNGKVWNLARVDQLNDVVTEVEPQFLELNRPRLQTVIKEFRDIEPWGMTPLGAAMIEAANLLEDPKENMDGGLICVITDGVPSDLGNLDDILSSYQQDAVKQKYGEAYLANWRSRCEDRTKSLKRRLSSPKIDALILALDIESRAKEFSILENVFGESGLNVPVEKVSSLADPRPDRLRDVLAQKIEPDRWTLAMANGPQLASLRLGQTQELKSGSRYSVRFGSRFAIEDFLVTSNDDLKFSLDWQDEIIEVQRRLDASRPSRIQGNTVSNPDFPTFVQVGAERLQGPDNAQGIKLTMMLNHDQRDRPVQRPIEIEFEARSSRDPEYRTGTIVLSEETGLGAPAWNLELTPWPENDVPIVDVWWKMKPTPPDQLLKTSGISASNSRTFTFEDGRIPDFRIWRHKTPLGDQRSVAFSVEAINQNGMKELENLNVNIGSAQNTLAPNSFVPDRNQQQIEHEVTVSDAGVITHEFKYDDLTTQNLDEKFLAFTSSKSRREDASHVDFGTPTRDVIVRHSRRGAPIEVTLVGSESKKTLSGKSEVKFEDLKAGRYRIEWKDVYQQRSGNKTFELKSAAFQQAPLTIAIP